MPATSRLHLTAGLLALGLTLAACGSDPQQEPAPTADAGSSTASESRDARETDAGSATSSSDSVGDTSSSSDSEPASGSSDAASPEQESAGAPSATDGGDDAGRSDGSAAEDGGSASDDAPSAAASDTSASRSADDDRSGAASSDGGASAAGTSQAASRDASGDVRETTRPNDDAEETSAAPSRETSTDARSTSTHAPATVAADELPAQRDLGGSQAGVAKDDTPVEVVKPAPAPPVVKVEEEHIAPADPVVVARAPATPSSAGSSSSDTASSSRPAPSSGSASSSSSSAGPSTSAPSSSTPRSSAPATSGAPSTSAAPAPSAAPSTAPHATPVPAGPVDCRVKRCIALTFDDGPGKHTGRLLDILAAEGVPATFYVVGRSADINPGLIARMGAEGHQVGNHSWDHPNLTTLSDAAVAEQIRRADAAIRAAGVRPSTVRAPYGALNESVLDTLGGLPSAGCVTWTVDTRDWEHRTPSKTLGAVQKAAAPGGIVLMHDIHSTTVDAVPSVISWLRAQGYTFVTVDTLTGGVPSGTTVNHGLRP